jgi:2-keto-3-deoxy-L-rhamnonate aldolase RhmA
VRGWGFGVAHDGYRGGDVVEKMGQENERTFVTALVETAKGIDNADEILSVAGVDVGWVGHYDLTNTTGITAQFEQEEFKRAVGKLFGACEGTEKPPASCAIRRASEGMARQRRALPPLWRGHVNRGEPHGVPDDRGSKLMA